MPEKHDTFLMSFFIFSMGCETDFISKGDVRRHSDHNIYKITCQD